MAIGFQEDVIGCSGPLSERSLQEIVKDIIRDLRLNGFSGATLDVIDENDGYKGEDHSYFIVTPAPPEVFYDRDWLLLRNDLAQRLPNNYKISVQTNLTTYPNGGEFEILKME